jgi:phosphatidylglycerol lysyltransferase
MVKRPSALVVTVTFATLGSGIVNLFSALGDGLPQRIALLRSIFPLEFLQLSRFLTLVAGLGLIVSSVNVYKRKRRALQVVALLSGLSIVFHLTKGIDYEEALCSIVLLALLVKARHEFTVKSRVPEWRTAGARAGLIVAIAVGYAASVHAHSPHLVGVLQCSTAAAVVYAGSVVFLPALYRQRTQPYERKVAAKLIDLYGRAALDFFKLWPDKSFFLSPTGEAFLAYRVAAGMAVVLGDPVGAPDQIDAIVRDFSTECERNDWRLAFYQTLPDYLALYVRAGLKRLKIGDDAIVDLGVFALNERRWKSIRTSIRKMEASGVRVTAYDPPIPEATLDELNMVSDEWLQFPGRRERQFALGHFDREYVRQTHVVAAVDAQGRILAFVNLLRSHRHGEISCDLMRRRTSAPNGIMDFLFIKVFLHCRERGFHRFNMGMAPMAGFSDSEAASPEERAVHAFFQQLGFLFSYKGLKAFKGKFATSWEPRYAIYRHVLDLPRLAIALARLSGNNGSQP